MDDHTKVYDEFFEHAMHLLNDHQKSPELIAGTMMAIAQRIYKTQLSDDEYEEMTFKFMRTPNPEPRTTDHGPGKENLRSL